MDKTRLNAQLFTTGLKRVFYHFKSVDCEISDRWKSFGLIANEKNGGLLLLLVGLVFGFYD